MNKRFTEEQILGFLCEADMGVPVRQLCSKHGFSERSYYQWRARIVAGKPSLAQRLAELETENSQLKQMLADAMLETVPVRAPASRGAKLGQPPHLAFAPSPARRDLNDRCDEPLEWPELLLEGRGTTH